MTSPAWGYVPTAYLDEVTPAPRATPDAWAMRVPGGAVLTTGNPNDPDPIRLTIGTDVGFERVARLGMARIVVQTIDTWRLDGDLPDLPPSSDLIVTTLDIGRMRSADSVEELACAIAAAMPLPYGADISFSAIHHETLHLRFDGAGFRAGDAA